MLDSTVFGFPTKKSVYIYCMLKKTGSSFLRYTSHLTKTARTSYVISLVAGIYFKDYSVIWWSHLQPPIFSMLLLLFHRNIFSNPFCQGHCVYFKTPIAAIHYIKRTGFTLEHLQSTVFIWGKQLQPHFFFTELLVIFRWRVLCYVMC